MLQQNFRSPVFHLIFHTKEILSGKDKETSFPIIVPQFQKCNYEYKVYAYYYFYKPFFK